MSHCFVADLGGTKVSAAVVDAQGQILARGSEPVDTSSVYGPVEQVCRLSAELWESGLSRPRGSRRRVSRSGNWRAAGLAVPGLVRRTGTVWAPNLPGWERIPLSRLLGKRLGLPVTVESDRNAAVMGEAWRGAGRGKSDVIALVVGTGIGAGILSAGRLIRGAHELSGCAGWMVVTEEENQEILRRGCLEALAAGPSIVCAAQSAVEEQAAPALLALGRDPITAEHLAEAARTGNQMAKALFERAGRLLGLAVANLISLFDPEVVSLGGGLAGAADLYFHILRRVALDRCQPLAARQVQIRKSPLGNDANLLGMAYLALHRPRA